MMITSIPPALPLIKNNLVNPLAVAVAVAAARRYRSLPDIPTMAEDGVPGVEANAGIGLVVPAGTPRAIIERYHTSTVKVINGPELREKLLGQGVELIGNSPEEFAASLKEEYARWERVVRTGGIKLNEARWPEPGSHRSVISLKPCLHIVRSSGCTCIVLIVPAKGVVLQLATQSAEGRRSSAGTARQSFQGEALC